MVSYRKLFELMKARNLNKFWLRKNGINPKIVAALWRGDNVTVGTIMKLCEILDVQPGDIMERVPDEESPARCSTVERVDQTPKPANRD